jgi:chromosome segregation ATPase
LRKRIEGGDAEGDAEELKRIRAECEAARAELTAAREEFARRMGVHTQDLLRLDGALQEALSERQRLGRELVDAREELARKAADYSAAVLKAGEELETGLARGTGGLDRLREELESTRAALHAETGKRQEAEAELHRERARAQERMRRFAAALEPVGEDWLAAR